MLLQVHGNSSFSSPMNGASNAKDNMKDKPYVNTTKLVYMEIWK